MARNMLIVAIALIAEGLFREPSDRWHPVAWFGIWATMVEGKFRDPSAGAINQRIRGVLAWLTVVLPCLLLVAVSLRASWHYVTVGYAFSAVVVWLSVSPLELGTKAAQIASRLAKGEVAESRVILSGIVGRITTDLRPDEVAAAAIESVAENSADAMVAPVIYAILFGPIGAVAYRAANTLDSMWGYRDSRYRFFGTAAARVDDVLSYVPSRCAALLLGAVAWLRLGTGRASLSALAMFGSEHPSPNSGRPEAAMAGALGVSIGGPVVYEGLLSERRSMCEGARPPGASDIDTAVLLLFDSWLLLLGIALCGGLVLGLR